jgi:hypothetical protein
MLKHRLARRLSTLLMLVVALVGAASAPAAPKRIGPYCQREITWDGVCVEICCTGAGCMTTAC